MCHSFFVLHLYCKSIVNKKVEERSWHDSYERVNDIIGLFELCVVVISTIVFIIAKVKNNEKIIRKQMLLWFVFGISSSMTAFFIAAERFNIMFLIVLGESGFPVLGDAFCRIDLQYKCNTKKE